MKTRLGFVSNSSTSSYIIKIRNNSDHAKTFSEILKENKKIIVNNFKTIHSGDGNLDEDDKKKLYKLIEKTHFNYENQLRIDNGHVAVFSIKYWFGDFSIKDYYREDMDLTFYDKEKGILITDHKGWTDE